MCHTRKFEKEEMGVSDAELTVLGSMQWCVGIGTGSSKGINPGTLGNIRWD